MNPSQPYQELIDRALAVREQAYAPYSRFAVGAAVLTDRGELFAGCNVENASYGLTICAERNAIFQAVSAGQRQLLAIAVVASQGVTPCGACRQVLAEFAEDMPILLMDPDQPSTIVTVTLRELLPLRFRRSQNRNSTN